MIRRLFKAWTRLRCRLGNHPSLDVIQSLGGHADHIGCPHCGREMGISYDTRTVLPWDRELEKLYAEDVGIDIEKYRRKWRTFRGLPERPVDA